MKVPSRYHVAHQSQKQCGCFFFLIFTATGASTRDVACSLGPLYRTLPALYTLFRLIMDALQPLPKFRLYIWPGCCPFPCVASVMLQRGLMCLRSWPASSQATTCRDAVGLLRCDLCSDEEDSRAGDYKIRVNVLCRETSWNKIKPKCPFAETHRPLRTLPAFLENLNSIPDTHIVWLKGSFTWWPSFFPSPLRVLTCRCPTRAHICSKVLKQTFHNYIGKMNDQAYDRGISIFIKLKIIVYL